MVVRVSSDLDWTEYGANLAYAGICKQTRFHKIKGW